MERAKRRTYIMLISAAELTASPGRSTQLSALVAQMRDSLSSDTGKQWDAWAAVAGRPYGTYGLSVRFDNYADMLGAQMKIAASSQWSGLASNADGVLAHPATTALSEVVAIAGEPAAPKQFTLVTRAVVDRSAMMDAMAWATEIAEYTTGVTGIGTAVCTSAAGAMFEVIWIAGADTPEEVDRMNSLGSDAGYLERLATAGANKLFEQGTSQRMLLAKMP
jgi:hypothetical protein